MRFLITIAVTFVALGLLAFFDAPKALGAHPWWSQQIVWIGAPAGLVIAFGALLTPTSALIRVGFFAIATGVAVALAHYGKTQFAASYAEDALAGQYWYFGWIGAATGLSATLTTLVYNIANRRVTTPYT